VWLESVGCGFVLEVLCWWRVVLCAREPAWALGGDKRLRGELFCGNWCAAVEFLEFGFWAAV